MQSLTDPQLIDRAAAGSQQALGELVRRHAGFVYSSALRQTRGDSHLAEDITQAVFIILARKIGVLKSAASLQAWLFNTTRYAAANAIRMQARRRRHERAAAAMRKENGEMFPTRDHYPEPEQSLDDALGSLREGDRSAVLLSYFAGKSWREVGAVLGTTEQAARKRVERAVVRMRNFFARRGTNVTAAAVASSLASAAADASAPPALVQTIISSLAGASTSAAVGGLAKGAIHMMTFAKFKVAALLAVIVLGTVAAAGAGAVMLHRNSNEAPGEKVSGPTVVKLQGDLRVIFHGIRADDDADHWWQPDGSPSERLDVEAGGAMFETTHQLVIEITGALAKESGDRIDVVPSNGVLNNTIPNMPDARSISVAALPGKSLDVRIALATGEWKTIAERPGDEHMHVSNMVVFGEPSSRDDGETRMAVTDDLLDHQTRFVVFATDGSEQVLEGLSSGITRRARQAALVIPLPLDKIEKIEFQARPYDQFVEFKNISLKAGHNPGYKLTSGQIEAKPDDDK